VPDFSSLKQNTYHAFDAKKSVLFPYFINKRNMGRRMLLIPIITNGEQKIGKIFFSESIRVRKNRSKLSVENQEP
jgi:hypothetical protein